MCGIVGYIGNKNNALEILINGLERLEYRGYDSCGVCYLSDDKLKIIKKEGKVKTLKEQIDFNQKSFFGIGHTRWATHGVPNTINSHPHKSGKITIVHNGIIENYQEIKEELLKEGIKLLSDTDSEVACALLNKYYLETSDILKAVNKFFKKARGSYAIVMMVENNTDSLYAFKKTNPLVIGVSEEENLVASDIPAILSVTNKYIILDDYECAILRKDGVEIHKDNKLVKKEIKTFNLDLEQIEKRGYSHFMLKEIHEEPEVIKKLMNDYLISDNLTRSIPNFKKYNHFVIIGCGSAVHAGLIGKSLIEEYANIKVDVEIASEYRYRNNFCDKKTLAIIISQSGETADSLAALEKLNSLGIDTLGIVNVPESSIARKCKYLILTNAGIEVAVATTKAYLAQVTVLSLITFNLIKDKISDKELKQILTDSKKLPVLIEELIDKSYKDMAKKIYRHEHLFFIGRDIDYSLSMEGSLKLKEISYLHSEAYPAGELKHGTISLIENNTPVIGIITKDSIAEKTYSNLKEVKARGAKVILIKKEGIEISDDIMDELILIPKVHNLFQPILSVIPLQLLAYEIAKLRKCDIDKPKNLAKSVTVE